MPKVFSLVFTMLQLSAPFLHAGLVPTTLLVERAVPKVIPGPGLPSLASLNLTSAQLAQQGPPPASNLEPRFASHACNNFNTAKSEDVFICYNYLHALGQHKCAVRSPKNTRSWFCSTRTAVINGYNQGDGPTASYCSDVAAAVQWLLYHCGSNGQVQGASVANGNGDIQVTAGGLQ